ncbi:MAG: low molecular weight protein-tyrosine-phosphatase [Erythrobacter sp.]
MIRASILMVCLGNICRSPLAEGAFRAAANAHGLDLTVDSCGTAAFHIGNAPDPRSIAVASQNGVDISALQARQLCEADFTEFTHIFAMDHENLANIKAVRPAGSTAEIALLMDNVSDREGEAIADPYYGGDDGFADTWEDVTAAAEAFFANLKSA